ncbi:MAG: aminoacetone oxidase family FAD-binding enzyme [Eubacterium sp.]|nr:aminoacetone oxidase family FAD-binding enzyme [Eubacterium sp.]
MYDKIYDVCIIGAGASGLVAAIESSRRGLSSVVVDKNKKPGMKLYATGNGRCNLTNDSWNDTDYYGNEFVEKVYDSVYERTGRRPRKFVIDYFEKLGVKTTVKKGYVYPASLQASSVVWSLLDAAKLNNTDFVSRFTVKKIGLYDADNEITEKGANYKSIYRISGTLSFDNQEQDADVYARSVIIATGGLSQKKLGAIDRDTLVSLLHGAGIPFNEFVDSLCPVIVEEDVSALTGVRTRVNMSVNGINESGELQITDKGISGIVTFNMSYYMNTGMPVYINALPQTTSEEFVEHFNMIKALYPEKSLVAFLNGYLNDKLCIYFINKFYGTSQAEKAFKLKDITETGILGIFEEITNWRLTVKSRCGFDTSQASAGGIITDVIDPETMQLSSDFSIGDNMYAAGEVTDVIGRCGGYNLTYAFISGYLAGNSVPR